MTINDIQFIFRWWITLLILGVSFLPFTSRTFQTFIDRGYLFSKVFALCCVTYAAFVLGELHVLAFTQNSLIAITFCFALGNSIFASKVKKINFLSPWRIYLGEEIIFLLGLCFWAYIRGLQPDIHGLEKFMDFGFVNSVLRTTYFPVRDMWYTPLPINYYYFGHIMTAVMTRLSSIPSGITFNLMIATLFSFSFSLAFSLTIVVLHIIQPTTSFFSKIKLLFYGLLGGYLLSFGGNLHTIYAFFKPYTTDSPVPFWQLAFSPQTFPNSYWYPNATRFIYHTIHEFPQYSFVVSDLHGHVLDIPVVLLSIAFLFSIILSFQKTRKNFSSTQIIIFGFLLAIMYMTNAWDGLIYLLLGGGVILVFSEQRKFSWKFFISDTCQSLLLLFVSFLVFALPFSLFFKPFASQIGILCAPTFLTKIGHFGPLLFEPNHCQKSPLYQLFILHGFFLFWVTGLFVFVWKRKKQLTAIDTFIALLAVLSLVLIVIPEFVYLKDIYPEHYRANTMFKLVYQSFIMLSFVTTYTIARLASINNIFMNLYKVLGLILFIFVSIYPYFSIQGYYGSNTIYRGLDGTKYLQKLYPDDYNAISWINTHISGQPVMLEAQGDSYTDYERISANTGLPTVLGWTVHEWLWRGSYDIVAPRITDVETLYTSTNISDVQNLIANYHIKYIYIGDLERQKYPNLTQNVFNSIGKIIYHQGTVTIYHMR